MKIIINSKQDYGTHVDEFTEEFECSVEHNNNILIISFEGGHIKLEENKMIYERNENKIIIQPDVVTECDYETEYGTFVLDIKGLSLENLYLANKDRLGTPVLGTIAIARYQIHMVGVEPYENIVEIMIK